MVAYPLVLAATESKDEVPVKDCPAGTEWDQPVCITIEAEADIKSRLPDCLRKFLGVKRAAAIIDISPIRLVPDRPDLHTETAEHLGSYCAGSPIGCIYKYLPAFKPPARRGDKEIDILFKRPF